MTYDTKNKIDSLDQENLVKLYKFIKILIDSGRGNSSQKAQLLEIYNYIDNKITSNNIRVSGGSLSDSDFNQASNIFNNIGGSSNTRYDNSEKKDLFDGIAGFGIFILIIVAIALVKGLFDIIVNLWNSGILKIILGLGLIGGGLYLAYKGELFKNIKNVIEEHRNKKQNATETSDNSKTKSKEKEENLTSIAKSVVKNLTVYSSALVVFATGMAHLDKHTNILKDSFLEDYGRVNRGVFEIATRFLREKSYELFFDYSEFENMGYMNHVDPNNYNNLNNLQYQDSDCYLSIGADNTWENLSYYCYGNTEYANHLRLYNSRYDLGNDIVYAGDIIFVPSPEKLEDYVYGKRLIKKR